MASSAGFTYDPATLQAASRDLAKGSASVQGELKSLAGRVQPLQQGFVGQAGEGFQHLWTEWQDAAQKLRESLEGLSRLLQGAAVNAAQMEEANKRLMRG